jgi:type II secretory pathway pseudopilin PulG
MQHFNSPSLNFKSKHKSSIKQLGISLLEVMLSLSIIALVLVMATRFFFVANNNDKMNTTISQVAGLVAAAHSWQGAQAGFAGIGIDVLGKAGQLSNFPGYDSSAQSLSTMWGQPITIDPSDSTTGGVNLALITVTLPTNDMCGSLLRSFPTDADGNITSKCNAADFTYSFP